jgi:alpha-glucosidase (family GH31 glycosyl hydrolase)
MDDYKLFTISQDSYAELPEKVLKIKEMNMHFVPIMDAGVAVRKNQGYTVLENGLTKDIFIKRSDNQAPLTAGVWCGHAYFPDFFKAATYDWWSSSFDSLYDDKTSNGLGLKFDGIWLDENEATNFCNGYCITSERPADSLRNKPFYVPGWRDLEDKALGVDGYHPEIDRHEYDVHNLFPLMQTKATADYLKKKLDESGKLRPYPDKIKLPWNWQVWSSLAW